MDEKKDKHSVHYSSESQTWNSPKWLFKELDEHWNFTLDAACIESSALCDKFFTPEDNSLVQDWSNDITYLNPPYNDLKTWLSKATEEYERGSTVVILVPSRTDTQAFQNYAVKHCSCICFIKGRLKFEDPTKRDEKTNTAPFPSCIIVLDRNLTQNKIDYLKTLGTVMKNV